jgi:ATP-dependent Zn protease
LANCVQRQPTFLNGQEFQLQRDCSEETAREIDEEVKKLLDLTYEQAKETLSDLSPSFESKDRPVIRREL